MYKIRGSDHKEYGPVSIDVLKEWIGERRVTGETVVQKAGSSEWRPLVEIIEFRSALLAAVPPATPAPATPAAGAPKAAVAKGRPSTALAITSLILGIFGVGCFGIFLGLPAIITGHMAHRWARRDPTRYQGRKLAMAGFILGYLSLVTTFIEAGIILPTLARMKAYQGSGFGGGCIQRVRQVTMCAHMYANEHNDLLPTDFSSLSNQFISPRALVCPQDKTRKAAKSWVTLSPSNITYELVAPGIKVGDAPPGTVIIRCPIHGHAGYADASVQRGSSQTNSITP